ncbi:MAG: VanZ family protein [Flavobacteriales bacterium]|jgi:hypothetical protein|nr:VanZ family protein [Flavobacteriales bacterium]
MRPRPVLRALPAALWATAVLVLLLAPPTGEAPAWLAFPHADKLVHAALFGVLAALVLRALRTHRAKAVAWGLTVLYGALTELLQHLLPVDRTGDPLDLLADAAGAALALIVVRRR